MERLNALVGEWQMDVLDAGKTLVRTTTVFEWFERKAFLVQRSVSDPPLADTPEIWIRNDPNPLVAVIGLDDLTEQFYYLYADRRGVRRVYRMSLDGPVWKLKGQAGPEFHQCFEGKFSADSNTILGRTERSSDGKTWELDFACKYTRKLSPIS